MVRQLIAMRNRFSAFASCCAKLPANWKLLRFCHRLGRVELGLQRSSRLSVIHFSVQRLIEFLRAASVPSPFLAAGLRFHKCAERKRRFLRGWVSDGLC